MLKPGEKVPREGGYRVHHYQHRIPHISWFRTGQELPKCNRCQDLVRFEVEPRAIKNGPAEIHYDVDFSGQFEQPA